MGIDAVVVGAIGSVVLCIVIIGYIGYKMIKDMGDNKSEK